MSTFVVKPQFFDLDRFDVNGKHPAPPKFEKQAK